MKSLVSGNQMYMLETSIQINSIYICDPSLGDPEIFIRTLVNNASNWDTTSIEASLNYELLRWNKEINTYLWKVNMVTFKVFDQDIISNELRGQTTLNISRDLFHDCDYNNSQYLNDTLKINYDDYNNSNYNSCYSRTFNKPIYNSHDNCNEYLNFTISYITTLTPPTTTWSWIDLLNVSTSEMIDINYNYNETVYVSTTEWIWRSFATTKEEEWDWDWSFFFNLKRGYVVLLFIALLLSILGVSISCWCCFQSDHAKKIQKQHEIELARVGSYSKEYQHRRRKRNKHKRRQRDGGDDCKYCNKQTICLIIVVVIVSILAYAFIVAPDWHTRRIILIGVIVGIIALIVAYVALWICGQGGCSG